MPAFLLYAVYIADVKRLFHACNAEDYEKLLQILKRIGMLHLQSTIIKKFIVLWTDLLGVGFWKLIKFTIPIVE